MSPASTRALSQILVGRPRSAGVPPRRALPPRRSHRPVREPRSASVTLGEPSSLDRVLPVRTGDFAAEARSRKHLARITQAVWIEGAPHALHRFEVVFAEHLRHVGLLVGADAVLPGNRATGVDAVLQDLRGHGFSALGLTGYRFVVANQRVQVAVAGMKDIANRQP